MFTAIATTTAGTLQNRIDVNGRHQIVTDEPLSVGGTDTGPAPHELLPAMLAACVATTIRLYAERRGWDLGETSVDVEYDNESTPRRASLRIRVPAGLSPEQMQRLAMAAATCPVKRALEAGFTFDHRIVTDTEVAPAGAVSRR